MALVGLRGAGIAISVKEDLRQVRRMLKDVEQKAVDRAAQQGLNRTITSVRGEAVKLLYRETGIKQKQIRDKLRLRRAQRGDLRAILDAEPATAANLIEYVDARNRKVGHFNRQLKSGKYKYEGVRARAWGKQKTYKGTFIGTNRKGRLRVYARIGQARNKLKLISGPSPRRTFIRDAIQSAMRTHAGKRWPVEFNRALANELRKLRAS